VPFLEKQIVVQVCVLGQGLPSVLFMHQLSERIKMRYQISRKSIPSKFRKAVTTFVTAAVISGGTILAATPAQAEIYFYDYQYTVYYNFGVRAASADISEGLRRCNEYRYYYPRIAPCSYVGSYYVSGRYGSWSMVTYHYDYPF
jgi:hypothetical protein